MGAALARHNLHVRLNDENIETLMYGLYVTRGEQVVDNHTAIYHDQPNCRSWEVYKGILDGRSRGGVQRQGVREARGAEDRRQADQPQPAAAATARGSTPSRSSRSSPTT